MRKGIYKITSPTGKIYIGKSFDIQRRWKSYYSLSCKSQPLLYASLLKHGVNNHTFEIQEEYYGNDNGVLSTLEIMWIQHYKENYKMLNCSNADGFDSYSFDELDVWKDRQLQWLYIMIILTESFNENIKEFLRITEILVNNNIVVLQKMNNYLVIRNNKYGFKLELK